MDVGLPPRTMRSRDNASDLTAIKGIHFFDHAYMRVVLYFSDMQTVEVPYA